MEATPGAGSRGPSTARQGGEQRRPGRGSAFRGFGIAAAPFL